MQQRIDEPVGVAIAVVLVTSVPFTLMLTIRLPVALAAKAMFAVTV